LLPHSGLGYSSASHLSAWIYPPQNTQEVDSRLKLFQTWYGLECRPSGTPRLKKNGYEGRVLTIYSKRRRYIDKQELHTCFYLYIALDQYDRQQYRRSSRTSSSLRKALVANVLIKRYIL